MSINIKRFHYLIKQYADNACSKEELLELLQLIEEGKNDQILESGLDAILLDIKPVVLPNLNKERIFRNILKPVHSRLKPQKFILFKLSAAAAVIVLMAGILWMFLDKPKESQMVFNTETYIKNDVLPGSNKAVLKLADGSDVILNQSKNGIIASQGGTKVVKLLNGELTYINGKTSDKTILYNTVSTPNGGEYKLILADGTNVWLNAASSIKYPTTFTGTDRNVEITGEVYFEVAHDKLKPFKVRILKTDGSDGSTVEVLGTHFNVNAYADEGQIKTTLLQGKVRIHNLFGTAILNPGQQSSFANFNSVISVKKVDVDQAIAWKNGYFRFDQADIVSITRQLSRWYNINFKFEGKITEDKFGGSIPRDAPLSQVLKSLEQSMVHFDIDGKTVIVKE